MNQERNVQPLKGLDFSPFLRYYRCTFGEVAEWSKAHDSKSCVLAIVPWVRIPPSPPSHFALRATLGIVGANQN